MALYDRRTSLDKNEYFYTENVIRNLETGLVVSVISPKKRAESLTIKVILETKELICIRTVGARPETTISLQQVKDLRVGKKSCDFERAEETYKVDSKLCLVLLYGNEFNLKTFSLQARDEKSFKIIYDGLITVLKQIKDSVYIEQKDRWIWKQFHNTLKPDDYALYCNSAEKKDTVRVPHKAVKAWLERISCKVKGKDFRYFVKRLKLDDHLSFPEFSLLFVEFLHPKAILEIQFEKYFPSNLYSEDERKIGFETFRTFLKEEQKIDSNPEETRKMMLDFVQDPVSFRNSLHMTGKEFIDFLFSPQNEIFKSDELTDDMDQPLSSYWIASSHNTYLTGNQISSESSAEPYARCLQMGCRCVELDCWDGVDGSPVIFHGNTLTSKVRLADVLYIINENAFKTSKFPVILSLENHCKVPQQRLMAKMMQEIFGDKLLTEPIVTSNGLLPSPNQLQNKIILKGKKLRDDSSTDGEYDGKVDAKLSGILNMKDKDSQMWLPYFCVLTDKMFIISPHEETEDEDEEEDDIYDFPYEDIFSGDDDDITIQTWYHGSLENHREAEKIIKKFEAKMEGAFLVRNNQQNGFTLSFWHKDRCNHCRIQSDNGQYYLNETVKMDSVTELIEYYKSNPLYLLPTISINLTTPVPVQQDFHNEIWFHNINREKAEFILQYAKEDGTFLIRPSSVENCYSLSMIYDRIIRHFPIAREGRLYVLGSFRFLHLDKLVDFFSKRAVYKNMRLKVPASENDLENNMGADDAHIYEGIYSCPTEEIKKVKVRALYDFMGDETQLRFRQGAIITNVIEEDSPWWKGNHGDDVNLLFPANYVEIVNENENDKKTEELKMKLEGCLMELVNVDKKSAFKLYFGTKEFIFNCNDRTDSVRWLTALNDGISQIIATQEKQKKEEMVQGRAKELSDMIVYCQTLKFSKDDRGAKIAEMSSFSESDIKPYLTKDQVNIITRYNQRQLSRVYPVGTRVLSANYDPIPMWSVGVQMVALNYQTPDRYQQINHALFLRNQRSGYVLKPQCMSSPKYSPCNMSSFSSVQPVSLYVSIIAGRNCCGGSSGATGNPCVSVEIIGLPLDKRRQRTCVAKGTTLCPIWENQLFVFDVTFPDLAFIRFEITDDSFEKRKTIYGQATFPLQGLREGYRCVPLHNMYNEKNELSSLLVNVELRNPMDSEEKNVFKMIEELRNHCASLPPNDDMRRQLNDTERQLLQYLDERQRRRSETYVPARRAY